MIADTNLAAAAALIGDTTRAEILTALLDGRPRPAGVLARRAQVRPATASQHLARLLDGGLVTVELSGRHRFYRLASQEVADALETLAAISPPRPVRSLRQAITGEQLRAARACYDHLAGALGVAVTDALTAQGVIAPLHAREVGTLLDPSHPLLSTLGLAVPVAAAARRPMVRGCLDWTERRPHLAGHLGATLLTALLANDWLRRAPSARTLHLTPTGTTQLNRLIKLPPSEAAAS